jgi:hypothetical protein
MANQVPAEQTPEQRDEAISARIPMLEKRYGPDITQPYLEETKAKREKLPEQMEKDKGLAIAMASLGLLSRKKRPGESQSNQLIAGLGEAGQSFIGEVGRLKKEHREVDDKLRQSEILLATAQQSRKEGLVNKADAEETRAQDLKRDAFKTEVGIAKDSAQLLSGLASTEMSGKTQKEIAAMNAESSLRSARINKEAGATADRQIAALAADLKEKNPNLSPAEINARATKEFLNLSGRYPGDVKAATAQETLAFKKLEAATEAWGSAMMNPKDPAYRKIKDLNAADPTGAASEDYKRRWIATEAGKSGSDAPVSSAAPASQPAPAQPTIKPGQVMEGYRFKGGDPADKSNWVKV